MAIFAEKAAAFVIREVAIFAEKAVPVRSVFAVRSVFCMPEEVVIFAEKADPVRSVLYFCVPEVTLAASLSFAGSCDSLWLVGITRGGGFLCCCCSCCYS